MGAIRPDLVETVRNSADIVRLISEYVPLKQAGTRFKGLCPFHQEKTPSFSVDAERQLFYCFGCQAGGDLFKFLMLYENLNFPEAVRFLADRFAIPIPEDDPEALVKSDKRSRTIEMNRLAIDYFSKLLQDEAGQICRDYLDRRGFGTELRQVLQLGFAAESWDGLTRFLNAKRFSNDELVESGLAISRKSGNGVYDRFRNRLIFPIHDVLGKPIAFGGRTLGDDNAKYINSPETPAYTKGEHLYGLDLAKEGIRREGFAIIVEGYVDAAAVRQGGFTNVVASLGTAFTAQQARLLARTTQKVVVSYDGDGAGGDAALKSLDLLLQQGFDVRMIRLPEGMDPDDCIRENGAEAYRKLIQEAPGYLDWMIQRQLEGRNVDRIEDKLEVVNAVLPHVAKLSNTIERASWITRLAEAARVEEEHLLQELRVATRDAAPRIRAPRLQVAKKLQPVEQDLVSLLLRSEESRSNLMERWNPAVFDGWTFATIVNCIAQRCFAGEHVDYPSVLEALTEESDRKLLTEIAFRREPEIAPSFDGCMTHFEKAMMSREESGVVRQLSGAYGSKADLKQQREADDLDSQLRRMQELASQRDALS